MQYSQGTVQDLANYTVAIQKAGSNSILGTGVIVTDDGLILTCYHVVYNIRTKSNDKTVDIYFPSAPKIKGHADVLEKYSDSSLDIALLQLKEDLPKQAAVANLSETIDPTHSFQSFGFRKEKVFDGLYSDGTIQGKVRKKFKGDNSNNNNISLQEVIQLKSDGIDHGMSGAAVLDTQINRVIGIVSEYLATSSNVDRNIALAIPLESIIQVYSELKQKNAGLRILEFLRKIDADGITKYERIDELYVRPINYDEIKQTLHQDRILFITGTQEYGKTYTAVNLLWEYFNKGYEPVWFKGSGNKDKRSDVREEFLNLEKYLKPYHIIYFEDPFGKTEYEVNTDEGIVRNIATIIDTVKNTDNTHVIITSREEVFKEFRHRITAEVDLTKYEKKLTIKAQSYNYEKRKEMLLKYAEMMNCKWREDKDLNITVLEIIKDKSKLPTPLNIEQFARATKKVVDKDDLLVKIDAKSKETARSFADEIKSMNKHQILFLLFPFISDDFSVDFVKSKYQEIIKDLKVGHHNPADVFKDILDWFVNDKIDVTNNYIRLSHPSFGEAIQYTLSRHTPSSDDAEIGKYEVRECLSIVLKKILTHMGIESEFAAAVVVNNFDILSEDLRNVLLKVAEDKEGGRSMVDWISSNFNNNFDILSEDLRNVLLKVAEDKEASLDIAHLISRNFDKLPEDMRNDLLFKIINSSNMRTTYWILWILDRNFDKFSVDVVTRLLLELCNNEVVLSLGSEKLYEKILVAHFGTLPEALRNTLILKLPLDRRINILRRLGELGIL